LVARTWMRERIYRRRTRHLRRFISRFLKSDHRILHLARLLNLRRRLRYARRNRRFITATRFYRTQRIRFRPRRVGKVYSTLNTGMIGYAGPRRATPTACEDVGRELGRRLRRIGVRRVIPVLQNPKDRSSKAVLRGIFDRRWRMRARYLMIRSRIPHGHGLRPPKPRRV
jgi:hypothetical protein